MPAATPYVQGAEALRAAAYLDVLTRRLGLPAAYGVTIHEAIPDHVGLGSGTQLALALAAALRHLECLAPDLPSDALALQRSQRSGIGAGLFERGGVIVDGGRAERTVTPPVIARLDFPRRVARHPGARFARSRACTGAQETEFFAALGPFDAAASAEICRLVLIKALPAVAEADIDAFGAAIERMQEIVGAYFAPAQGGAPYTSAAVAETLAALKRPRRQGRRAIVRGGRPASPLPPTWRKRSVFATFCKAKPPLWEWTSQSARDLITARWSKAKRRRLTSRGSAWPRIFCTCSAR